MKTVSGLEVDGGAVCNNEQMLVVQDFEYSELALSIFLSDFAYLVSDKNLKF